MTSNLNSDLLFVRLHVVYVELKYDIIYIINNMSFTVYNQKRHSMESKKSEKQFVNILKLFV